MLTPAQILVAEDNPDDIAFLQRAFQRALPFVPVDFVRDGQEALDYLQGLPPFPHRGLHGPPELLLLDLHMPRLDGFEVLDWLAAHLNFRPAHIVLLTSSTYELDLTRASLAHVDHYIVKPSDPAELLTALKLLAQDWLSPTAQAA